MPPTRAIGHIDLVDLMQRRAPVAVAIGRTATAADLPSPAPSSAFDGDTYSPKRDHARLKGTLAKVFDLMSDGQWRTLEVIGLPLNVGDASISARLRDLRKAKYGSHTVERRHVRDGLFEYRLIVNHGERNV